MFKHNFISELFHTVGDSRLVRPLLSSFRLLVHYRNSLPSYRYIIPRASFSVTVAVGYAALKCCKHPVSSKICCGGTNQRLVILYQLYTHPKSSLCRIILFITLITIIKTFPCCQFPASEFMCLV